MRDRIAVIARHDWAGFKRLPEFLDSVIAPPMGAWVAVGSPVLDGVTSLAPAYADLLDATRTALDIGIRGWLTDPGALAVERLLLASRELGDAAVARELGPLLADERLGTELVETLQVYFDSRREHARDRPPAPPREPRRSPTGSRRSRRCSAARSTTTAGAASRSR